MGAREKESFIPLFRMRICLKHLKQVVANGYSSTDARKGAQQCVNSKDFKHGGNVK